MRKQRVNLQKEEESEETKGDKVKRPRMSWILLRGGEGGKEIFLEGEEEEETKKKE